MCVCVCACVCACVRVCACVCVRVFSSIVGPSEGPHGEVVARAGAEKEEAGEAKRGGQRDGE